MRRFVLSLCFGTVAAFFTAGCDTLFPELTGANSDLTVIGDGGTDAGTGLLTGTVCLLADLRSPQSCTGAAVGRRITIEETRATADVAMDGSFSISLAGISDTATVAVLDGPTTTGKTTPTVSRLSGAILTRVRASGVVLPCVRADLMSNLALAAGSNDDPARGAILGWLVDPTGKSISGAAAARMQGGIGPLYDANSGSTTLSDTSSTGAYGTVAFVDLPPGNANIVVTTNAASAVAGDTFVLPIRGGAITTAALALPSRWRARARSPSVRLRVARRCRSCACRVRSRCAAQYAPRSRRVPPRATP